MGREYIYIYIYIPIYVIDHNLFLFYMNWNTIVSHNCIILLCTNHIWKAMLKEIEMPTIFLWSLHSTHMFYGVITLFRIIHKIKLTFIEQAYRDLSLKETRDPVLQNKSVFNSFLNFQYIISNSHRKRLTTA